MVSVTRTRRPVVIPDWERVADQWDAVPRFRHGIGHRRRGPRQHHLAEGRRTRLGGPAAGMAMRTRLRLLDAPWIRLVVPIHSQEPPPASSSSHSAGLITPAYSGHGHRGCRSARPNLGGRPPSAGCTSGPEQTRVSGRSPVQTFRRSSTGQSRTPFTRASQ